MKIILGSESKWRKGVLEKTGYKFDVMPSYIDEKAIRDDDPEKLTILLAQAKADALIEKIAEPVLLITSDQVAVWNGKIHEKPESKSQAREYLMGYGSHPVKTVTAVVVTNTETRKRATGVDIVEITFSPILSDVIDKLIEEGNVFSQAGGFSVEDSLLKEYVKEIKGDIDSVMGMPLVLTKRLIKEVTFLVDE